MQAMTLVGIDLGKHLFHLHGQDLRVRAVFRKKVNRKQLVDFFPRFTPARSSWKLVPVSTLWCVSELRSGTRSTSFRRGTCGLW